MALWLAADPNRSARARECRILSARRWDEEAENVLYSLGDSSGPGSIVRARELASHYRWRAKCYAPKDYGDKVEVAGDPNAPLTHKVIDPAALAKLTPEELDVALAAAEKLSGQS